MAGETGWVTFGAKKPLEHHVHLPMVADSSVETGVEIDTGLEVGMKMGWALVGMDWGFRTVASPHLPIVEVVGVTNSAVLQLARGDLPTSPLMLSPKDDNLIYDSALGNQYVTGVGHSRYDAWHRHRKPARTQKSKLYMQFGTVSDWTDISAATTEIFAILYYFLVSAPVIEGHNE